MVSVEDPSPAATPISSQIAGVVIAAIFFSYVSTFFSALHIIVFAAGAVSMLVITGLIAVRIARTGILSCFLAEWPSFVMTIIKYVMSKPEEEKEEDDKPTPAPKGPIPASTGVPSADLFVRSDHVNNVVVGTPVSPSSPTKTTHKYMCRVFTPEGFDSASVYGALRNANPMLETIMSFGFYQSSQFHIIMENRETNRTFTYFGSMTDMDAISKFIFASMQ